MRPAALICIALYALMPVLTGCDSTEPSSITSTGPLPDLALRIGSEPYPVRLSDYFDPDCVAPLDYSVEVSYPIVSVERLDSSRISIRPTVAGSTEITVEAHCGTERHTSNFRVTCLCPVEPGLGDVSYFPHEVGQTWAYDYDHYHHDNMLTPWRQDWETGVMRWTVVGSDDQCDAEHITINEEFFGDHITKGNTVINPYAYDTTYTVSWQRTATATVFGDLLVFEGRVGFTASDSVRWIGPAGSPADREYHWDGFFRGGWREDVTFSRGVGLLRYSFSSAEADQSIRLTLDLRR